MNSPTPTHSAVAESVRGVRPLPHDADDDVSHRAAVPNANADFDDFIPGYSEAYDWDFDEAP